MCAWEEKENETEREGKETLRERERAGDGVFWIRIWVSRALCFLGSFWIVKIVCIATVLHREGIPISTGVGRSSSLLPRYCLPLSYLYYQTVGRADFAFGCTHSSPLRSAHIQVQVVIV